jgi:hypothetical protein
VVWLCSVVAGAVTVLQAESAGKNAPPLLLLFLPLLLLLTLQMDE